MSKQQSKWVISNLPKNPNILSDDDDYDQHDYKWQKAKRFAKDTEHRGGLILWVKWVVSLWLGGVLFVVSLNSIVSINLSDSVLVTLLATTTANILGLAYIVLKGMFNTKE